MGPRKLPDSASAVVDHPHCRHTNEGKDRAKPRVQLVSVLWEIDRRQGLAQLTGPSNRPLSGTVPSSPSVP